MNAFNKLRVEIAAMTSSKARKDLPTALPVPDMSNIVFATLELTNEAGQRSATALGRNYSQLSNHHRQYLRVKRIIQQPKPATIDDDESEYEPEPADLPASDCYEAKWHIIFKANGNGKQVVGSGLTIGKGQTKFGNARGVDLLVIPPGSNSKGVKATHALVRFHPVSGYLMLGGIHDEYPVRYVLDNQTKDLGNGQWHALWQTKNRFFIGDLECTITFPDLTETQLGDLRRLRDTTFESDGLPTPDKRLPVLPLTISPHRVNSSILVHTHLNSGGFGVFSLGVDINTGEVCGVKDVCIKSKRVQQDIANEADFSLRFAGKKGLLQASCVSYGGRTFGPGRHKDLRTVFAHGHYPQHAHFILPLGKFDFTKLNRAKYDFPRVVEILQGVVVGLATLHSWGIQHRDVTAANMLVMSDDPPVGVLCDFGKAIQQDWDTSNATAPRYAQAPEINGVKRYNAKADVWSCGLAFASVFFPDMSKWPSFQSENSQSKAWTTEVCKRLEDFGSQSVLHGMIAIIVAKMLDFDPKTRPPMEMVLDKWPFLVSAEVQHVSLDVGGRCARIATTSAISQSYKNGCYKHDWFGIHQATPPKRVTGYKPLTRSAAAILPSKAVVNAHREAADMMRVGQGFTPEHPERPSQVRFDYTVRKITAMAEKRQAEEANTEILTENELPASTAGPDWDQVPEWGTPISGRGGDVSHHTAAGPCENEI
ncbi:MAG: hypothetical protein Q9195_005686 [Heterodermia aff. obscurata]